MRSGQKSLQLEAPLARALRIAFGVSLLAALFLVLGSSGAFAATNSSADEPASSTAPAKHGGLLSGILNPVAGVVDQTLDQLPVVNDITGADTVGTLLAPVTGVTDRLENTVNSVPVVAAATAPVQEAATVVVPPVTGVVGNVAAAVVPPVANVVSGVTTAVLPPVVTEVVLPPVVDVVSGVTTGVLPPVADTVTVVTAPVLDVVDQVVDTVDTVDTPVLPQVPGVPVVPEIPVVPAAPATPAAPAAPTAPVMPIVPALPEMPVAPAGPAGQGVWDGTYSPIVESDIQSGAESGSDAAQEPAAPKSAPAETSKSNSAARDGADATVNGATAPATVNGVSPFARYVTANITPGAAPVPGAAAKSLAVQPDGSPAAVACGAEVDGSAVGPCPPATPANTGSSSSMSSGGPGASGVGAAAHENSSNDFHLAGTAAALPNADWPLPASMPSNPGSTPG